MIYFLKFEIPINLLTTYEYDIFLPECCMKINENMKASDLSASGGLVQNPSFTL